MEWVFAKKIVLCLLIVLNVILFFLNSNQIENYNIASHKKTEIISVLENFGLTLDSSIDLSRTASARLKVGSFSYTEEVISKAFFQNEPIISTENKRGAIAYESDSFLLELSGNTGLFWQKLSPTTQIESEEMALQVANQMKEQLVSVFGELQQLRFEKTDTGYVVEYFGVYKENVLFSNYFTIAIGETGKVSMQFQYFDLIGTEVESKSVIDVDKALFSFVRAFQKEGHITNVTEGYYLSNKETAFLEEVELYLEPCYQISLEGDPTIYLIEGYNGEKIV